MLNRTEKIHSGFALESESFWFIEERDRLDEYKARKKEVKTRAKRNKYVIMHVAKSWYLCQNERAVAQTS
jgi:hypothetical protein